ncbi:hypothetical protein [Epilithonimonas sp.]|uniref:hypothetical protein n=1 Tax=Epilithonimonas sp. TaxID=2894511 RepID=UPI0035B2B394
MKKTLLASVLALFTLSLNAQSNVSYSNIFFNNLYPNAVSGNTAEQTHYHIMSTGGGTGGSPLLDVKWWGGLNFESEGGNVRLKSPYGTLFMSIGGNTGINTEDPKATLDVRGSARINSLSGYSHLGLGQQTNDMIIADNSAEKLYGGGYFFRVHNDSAPNQYIDALMIDDNGNVGIGVQKPNYKLDINGSFQSSSNGNSFAYNGGADLILRAPVRGTGGRAIVHDVNNTLSLNYEGDFTGGTKIGSALIVKNNGEIYAGGPSSVSFQDDARFTVAKSNVPSLTATSVSMPQYGFLAPNVTGSAELWMSGNAGIRMFTAGDSTPKFNIATNGNASLNGKFEAKEVKVTLSPTADFVFEEKYDLPKLENVEKFIKENKHLPEVASAKEMEKEGVNVGEFQIKLLQKIEELTLYTIEQNKINQEQGKKIEELEKQLIQLNSKK